MTNHCASRASTHAEGCWSWGPGHYKCAVRRIGELERYKEAAAQNIQRAQAEARELRTELARVQGLCPEVIAFAHLMQRKLDINAHKDGEGWSRDSSGKRGWKNCSVSFLRDKLAEEVDELIAALREPADRNDVAEEAADVGNIAMMLADVCGALSQPATVRESLPLMAPATAARVLNDEAQRPLGRRYRVTDTDEHGLPVIERTADMPEGAKYRLTWIMQADAAEGDVEYTDSLPLALEANRSGAVSERIEDYRESGQEGKE